MARTLDQIIVIDVEATCWEGLPPSGQESEIIEVGICAVEVATARPLQKRSVLVHPERSQVSAFCTRLTTLTPEQVASGVSFREACALLRDEYSSKERVWASYGDYDRRQFERQCQARQIGYPFGPTHLNVKNWFAIVHALPNEVGMEQALQVLDLHLEGTHHRAGDDAGNIARILAKLLVEARGKRKDHV